MSRQQKIYCTLRRRYSKEALIAMGFKRSGSDLVKLGACRVEYATASLDARSGAWRITPLVGPRV
jgi:hypothetical protein